MISLTGEYALRAMIHLAQNSARWPIPASEIAARSEIPPKYLSAILGALARRGLLEATRGKSGGFRMVKPAAETSLLEVLAPFESPERGRCPFGNIRCRDADPCVAHESWKQVIGAFQRFLRTTTVGDVAARRKLPPEVRRAPGAKRPAAQGAGRIPARQRRRSGGRSAEAGSP